ncbi:hypothetical protein pb186bvf_002363 [Paramecium bursaria]
MYKIDKQSQINTKKDSLLTLINKSEIQIYCSLKQIYCSLLAVL